MNIYRYDIEGEHIYVAALTKNQADFIIVESDMVEPEDLTEPYMLSESQWDRVSVYDEENDKSAGTLRDMIKDLKEPEIIATSIS